MSEPTSTEVPLISPPDDGITALKFSATSNLLLVSSWDTVRSVSAGQATLSGRCPSGHLFVRLCPPLGLHLARCCPPRSADR